MIKEVGEWEGGESKRDILHEFQMQIYALYLQNEIICVIKAMTEKKA